MTGGLRLRKVTPMLLYLLCCYAIRTCQAAGGNTSRSEGRLENANRLPGNATEADVYLYMNSTTMATAVTRQNGTEVADFEAEIYLRNTTTAGGTQGQCTASVVVTCVRTAIFPVDVRACVIDASTESCTGWARKASKEYAWPGGVSVNFKGECARDIGIGDRVLTMDLYKNGVYSSTFTKLTSGEGRFALTILLWCLPDP
jgi:hypothetical protein